MEKEILALDFNPVGYFKFLKSIEIYSILKRGATQLIHLNYLLSIFRPKIVSLYS